MSFTYAKRYSSCTRLHTHRFGNACKVGGLRVAGRLNLIKQNVNDISILTPNNHTVRLIALYPPTPTHNLRIKK